MTLDFSDHLLFSQYSYAEYCHLAQKLNRCALLYSQAQPSPLSDEDYDRLFRILVQIEKSHPEWVVSYSPSQRIDFPVAVGEKGKHSAFIGSLENIFELSAYYEWEQNCRTALHLQNQELCVVAELKIDGLALSLVYQEGFLVDALTRGDGVSGERVLAQVRCIPTIPFFLGDQTFSGLIRGEVFFKKEDFDRLNQTLIAKGEKPFSHPRNAAAGTLRNSDLELVKHRTLSFLPYAVLSSSHPFLSHTESLAWCEDHGFEPHPWRWTVMNPHQMERVHDRILSLRPQLPFGIDGIVCKIDQVSFQKELGENRRTPRWAVAWKLPADCVRTVLNTVVWQVGRLGHITPVAVFDPVLIDGVSLSCASLHNMNEIAKKNIALGQEILVRRAGDVIPEVIGPVFSSVSLGAAPIEAPSHCPSCQGSLSLIDDHLYCLAGYQCLEQKILRFAYAFGPEALNVPRLSYQTLKKAIVSYQLHQPSDLFRLNIADWMSLEGIAQKSAEYFYHSLRENLKTTEERFLLSCNIRHIGKATASIIFENLSWDEFLCANKEQLEEIAQIGPVIAKTLYEFKTDPQFLQEYQSFQNYGLEFQPRITSAQFEILKGFSFCVTGSFSDRSREQWKEWIEKYGGSFAQQLTKKTDFLILGAQAGSKHQKALQWGISVLANEDLNLFISMVEQGDQDQVQAYISKIHKTENSDSSLSV